MNTVSCLHVGPSGSGKRSLQSQFRYGRCIENVTPVEDYLSTMDVDGQRMELVLQASGDARYCRKHLSLACAKADIILLCMNAVCPSHLDHITNIWRTKLKKMAPKVPHLLVLTRPDLRADPAIRVRLKQRLGRGPVSTREGAALARATSAEGYIECSALNREQVQDLYREAVRVVVELRRNNNVRNEAKNQWTCTLL